MIGASSIKDVILTPDSDGEVSSIGKQGDVAELLEQDDSIFGLKFGYCFLIIS